jgi:hypothetical protein
VIARALTLGCVLAVAACAASPAEESPAEPAPIVDGASPDVQTPVADAPADTSAEEPEPTAPAAPVTGPDGRYLPPPGRELRFAGIESKGEATELIRLTQASTEDGARQAFGLSLLRTKPGTEEFDEPVTAEWAAWREQDVVWVTPAADSVHATGPPIAGLLTPPQVGARWELASRAGTAHCLVEAIEDVATFAGERKQCARVRTETPAGTILRWHDQELGVIRTEIRNTHGALSSAWALVGDEWPSRAEIEKLLR